MITYWTWSGWMPALPRAPLMAKPPSSTALKGVSDPSSRPIPVRAPPMMTGSPMPALPDLVWCLT